MAGCDCCRLLVESRVQQQDLDMWESGLHVFFLGNGGSLQSKKSTVLHYLKQSLEVENGRLDDHFPLLQTDCFPVVYFKGSSIQQ